MDGFVEEEEEEEGLEFSIRSGLFSSFIMLLVEFVFVAVVVVDGGEALVTPFAFEDLIIEVGFSLFEMTGFRGLLLY